MKTRFLLFGIFVMLCALTGQAQLSIDAGNTNYTINFDATVSGVNNGQFWGEGFQNIPSDAQLDSDAWDVTGMSDGDSDFGDNNISGDFGRGDSEGGVTTGGFYAFSVGTGNNAFGVQPTGSDFSPGTITLRIQNNSGTTLPDLEINYNIVVYNNENRSSTLNFSHSADNINYLTPTETLYTTPEAEDASPAWQTIAKTITITGINLADGNYFYLRWSSNDVGGSGSRDEFGIDDIVINAELPDKPEPTNYPTGFDATALSTTEIENTWTDATGGELPDGYLILSNLTGSFTAPANGTPIANDIDLSDGSGAMNIIKGTEVYGWSGLLSATQYFYVIYPYTNSGSNIKYKTDGTAPTADATTNSLPSIVINEIHADPDPDNGDANGDGEVNSYDDEFVEIINNSDSPLNISGYTLSDQLLVRHTFPGGTIIPAHDAAVVFGGGTPTGFGDCIVQVSSEGGLSLNNSGDQVIVKNSSGDIMAQVIYTSEAGDNQSITRDPDVSGEFVKHSTATGANGALYSPCGKIDGSPFVPGYDFVVELKDSNGEYHSGGSLEYREGGGNPWLSATEFSTGEFGINTERTKVGLRMTFGPMIQKIGGVPTSSLFTFTTELVTVKLENSSGEGVEGGLVDYTSNGWHSFGTTGADGTVQKEMLPLKYSFKMTYNGDKEVKKETISPSNNYITFYLDDLKIESLDVNQQDNVAIYPNPFSKEVNLAFSLADKQQLTIAIFDLQGKLIDKVFEGEITEGQHKIIWSPEGLKNGIYICRITTNNNSNNFRLIKTH